VDAVYVLTPLPSGQQYQLLDWLENVTFPMEAKFSDIDFARRTYRSVVRRIIDSGVRIFGRLSHANLEQGLDRPLLVVITALFI
jgi:cytosine/adenosine deaminase-related metal-dependent hydrolase